MFHRAHLSPARLLLFAAVLAAVGTGAAFFERGPDPVVFPPHSVPLHFDHQLHVRKSDEAKGVQGAGLSCEFCHENVAEQTHAFESDIPGHGTCDSCHDDWIGEDDAPAPVQECARCHKDLRGVTSTVTPTPARLVIPKPNIKFAHANHVKAGIQCVECHKDVPNKTVATRDDYPTMDRCVACHQERKVSVDCITCHMAAPSGRMLTRFPEGVLKPNRFHAFAVHDGDFLRSHAVPAQKDRWYCQQCHTDGDCLECHDGIGRDARFHPADWMAMHGIRGKKDDHRCQSCHRFQTFCIDCHVRTGISAISTVEMPALQRNFRREQGLPSVAPHPLAAEGWLTPGSRNFHGFYAQRNIRACASCHQEQSCLQCHASGFAAPGAGAGINPHGPNPERLRGSTAARQNARACLKCHNPADPSWR